METGQPGENRYLGPKVSVFRAAARQFLFGAPVVGRDKGFFCGDADRVLHSRFLEDFPDQHSDFGAEEAPSYFLEHLATFSVGQQYALETPKDGLRKLFQMEKSKGIWTQKMKMKLDRKWVIIIDCENGDVVERFPMSLISDPTAFTSDDPRELYNNILVFVVQDDPTSSSQQEHSEMHIFQCVRISAKEVVDDIKAFIMGKSRGKFRKEFSYPPYWLRRRSSHDRGSGLPPPPNVTAPEPPVNGGGINVREQVSIFNAAAVSQGSPPPPSHGPMLRGGPPPHDKIDAHHARGIGYTRESNDETSSTTSEKYERDVAILNHCFDDIERFIRPTPACCRSLPRTRTSPQVTQEQKEGSRRQVAPSELLLYLLCLNVSIYTCRIKDSSLIDDGMLSMRAKPPPDREFVDILQKFKLSFNLLARDCGRPGTGASLAARVVSPLLTRDALELLANCCTSKESDLWHSLGDAWVVPRDMWKGYESESYQPVFSDGWAPDCSGSDDQAPPPSQPPRMRRRSQEEVELRDVPDYHPHRGNVVSSQHDIDSRYGGSDYLSERVAPLQASPYDRGFSPRDHMERQVIELPGAQTPSESDIHDPRDQRSELSVDSMEAGGGDPQRQWRAWAEALRDQGAKIVQVVYPRTANNDKELTVVRGEFLEILDDSRKWWKTRNIRGQVGHVPHTIVTPCHLDDSGSVGYERSSSRENYNRSPYPPGGAFADMGLEVTTNMSTWLPSA
ncbi:hypothetical protein HPB51_004416 [Rhipicephalus microplus]|uniref:SH3 domain-containing protein n=1 Tax=Rhipicephalus microplus TaxID=6941 RepID=A0A9J6ELQ6_RHIMP|nr:hypothetical protein HPB51_004416 [Rhipicephalus microplus]